MRDKGEKKSRQYSNFVLAYYQNMDKQKKVSFKMENFNYEYLRLS